MQPFTAEEDVLCHGQVATHVQLLMNDRNAKGLRFFGGEFVDLLAKELDVPAITRIHAAEDFHQGRFACAVFTQQSEDLASL